jgi:hypothetical protein
MVNIKLPRRRERQNQSGLTMVEIIVAVAISMLIVVGSLIFLRYMITVADDNRDKTMATLEVQYVGFWLSEDVAQAQTIEFEVEIEEQTEPQYGFPLRLICDEWDGSQTTTITYYVETMDDGELWRLMRKHVVEPLEGPTVSGTSQVAEYLIPWSDVEDLGTKCCRMVYDTDYDTMKSMIVEVAARADRSEASSSYEIYPRTVVEWLPEDIDGNYIGPDCPVS